MVGTVGVVGAGGGQRGGCLSEEEATSFVRGVLRQPHLQEVETHLDSCGRCLEYVAALAQSVTSQRSTVTDSRTTQPDATPVERPAVPSLVAPVEAAMFRGTERFRVLRRLGAGGMGVVYEAFDREHGSRIALKVLPALAPDGLLRFKNEFRALQDLEHPNLVRMGELFVCDGQWFFTMELVEGTDFLRYIRTARFGSDSQRKRDYDVGRLRSALRQLAVGLNALHASGTVHRDIKPKNTLVTTDGRLVILDFGLVRAWDIHDSSDFLAVGTVAYMAPEQAASRPVGPAADWYSVGVMLFEALTGRLPFTGAPLEILADKQSRPSVAVEQIEPDVPADLALLCNRLLRLKPQERPDGDEVLRHLADELHPPRDPALLVSIQAAPFVGRSHELSQLRAAFAATRAGESALVVVEGESGIGKSALVRHFGEELRAERPDVVLLKGRCYERESVAYKAFDGILDALSRLLSRLDRDEAAALLPRWKTALLAQAFPVLGRVEAVAAAPALQHAVPDPQELRSLVFSALRDLFIRLGERQPLVLVIDDLQWADADSLSLLAELMRDPDPPALLLVATLRSSDVEAKATLRNLPQTLQRLGDKVTTLRIERLPPNDAQALAAALLQRTASRARLDAAQLAEEARGHPLYIDELVRHQATVGAGVGAARLDEVLWSRICLLDAPVSQLLAAVSVAGGPLPQGAAKHATALEPNAFHRALAVLRVEHLARTTGSERSDLVECYHDRVREAVVAHLGAEEQRDIHRRLAMALTGTADAELLAVHWHAAGEPDRAARFSIKAAENAAEALAFDRAARLYDFALRLIPEHDPERGQLFARLGEMLANAGRGREAAAAYLAAVPGTSDAEASLELRRRAAEQFLICGHIDDGINIMRSALAELGVHMPSTPTRALASLLLHRALVRLHGLRFERRDASQIDAHDLERIDMCQSVAKGLTVTDTIRGADFQARTTLLALKVGEPARVCEALCVEAAHLATVGARARAQAGLELASRLARESGDPRLLATTTLTDGVSEFMTGHWLRGLKLCDEASALFRERCSGVWWHQYMAASFSLWALMNSGRLTEMSERSALWSAEAAARGNPYLECLLQLRIGAMLKLAADDPEGARQQAENALTRWSRTGFHVQHYQERIVQCWVDLYLGDGLTAHRRITETWPYIKKNHMLRTLYVQYSARTVRARCTLLAAAQTRDRRRLLRQADHEARKLRGQRMPWSEPQARSIEAGCAALSGRLDVARDNLAIAVRGFDEIDMALEAAAARHRLGEIIGGDEGRALIAACEDYMRQQRVRRPERMMALFAPGFNA